jgi:dihydropteroate synthase
MQGPVGASSASGVFQWGARTYIMGILNITPDSFSGDGLLEGETSEGNSTFFYVGTLASAQAQAQHFLQAGADILDVGGESTRPGSSPISVEEEVARVVPVIKTLVEEFSAFVSIDTYKAAVAEAAIQAGAKMINDVWGLHVDPDLAKVAAKYQVPLILMHNRSSWAHAEIKERLGGRYVGMAYDNLLEDIRRELMESVEIARSAGVAEDKIILDPGIGFGKQSSRTSSW